MPSTEETFDILHKRLRCYWTEGEKYDTIEPFGDSRQLRYHAFWTFDTPNDVLRRTDANSRSQIPLALLRERTASLADMESTGGPVPVPVALEYPLHSEKPYWKPQIKVDNRMHAFTHRLLCDFNHQWRHILRNNYNSITLRVLAKAIVRLATLDFQVHENTGGHGPRGMHVWITDLPAWEPFTGSIIRIGAITTVICQNMQDGLSTVKQLVASQDNTTTEGCSISDSEQAQVHYIVLSIKYIMLCHATSPASLKHTAPEPLFHGDNSIAPPYDLALDYLIWATSSARASICTPIQLLPIEIQDKILNNVSTGSVVAAKVGCLLGLGSPFLWKDGPLKVTLTEEDSARPLGSPVESEVWFGKHRSGIVYLAQS